MQSIKCFWEFGAALRSPNAKPPRRQLYTDPRQRGQCHLPVGFRSLLPHTLPSPRLWQPLSKSDPVTLKQKPSSIGAAQPWNGNCPPSPADNYLNKFPLKTQIPQTTSWAPNLNQANSSISKCDLRMKLMLITRDKNCYTEDSKNYYRLGGRETGWE